MQHFLNFFPLPQGQGSFRPILAVLVFIHNPYKNIKMASYLTETKCH